MNKRLWVYLCVATAVALALARPAGALINAKTQPDDIYELYADVMIGRVTAIDVETQSFTVEVTKPVKGGRKPGEKIVITAVEAKLEPGSSTSVDVLPDKANGGSFKVGSQWVGFSGKQIEGHENEFLFYCDLKFGLGTMDSPGSWRWTESDREVPDESGGEVTLAGTWIGSTKAFVRLIEDLAAGMSFLPRKAYVRFEPDFPLIQLPGPARGLAVYDIDADGDLDILACCTEGVFAFFQVPVSPDAGDEAPPVDYRNATGYIGLEGVTGPSCSFADVNADGRGDLLVGGRLYLAGEKLKNCFARRCDLLPPEADENVKSSAFVELNGDGYPDVMVSKLGGGLHAYLNPGPPAGEAFTDATREMGLADEASGAKLNGFFTAGDWNGDGRYDLFYAAGKGLLLVQEQLEGRWVFRPVPHDTPLDFVSGADREVGLTGAGAFAALFGTKRPDLVVPTEAGWALIANQAGKPVDVTGDGGEITEGSYMHLATICGDLTLDGRLDLYTIARGENGHNRFISNRGYGMFMHTSKNPGYDTVFQGPAHQSGGRGVAAGDLNDDGAPDLVIGNARGELVILLNETLKLRTPVKRPVYDIKEVLSTKIVNVRVRGRRGVLGAKVTLADAQGNLLGRRHIGQNIATGCRGPDAVTFAVRRAKGTYKLKVRFADGHEQTWDVNLDTAARVKLDASRTEKRSHG